MKPYLIQRAKFENRDYKKGIDSIISLDYMGSAEFEWGALPDSLKEIRKNKEEYAFSEFSIQGKDISIFCKESEIIEVRKYLLELALGNPHLKEYSGFNTYIKPSKYDLEWQVKHGHTTDFWWDIKNHVMFWKKNIEFETHFKNLI